MPHTIRSARHARLAQYTGMEHLAGANCYECEVCASKQEAYKGIRLKHVPPILTISLNRYT